jgi:hypothetical protein
MPEALANPFASPTLSLASGQDPEPNSTSFLHSDRYQKPPYKKEKKRTTTFSYRFSQRERKKKKKKNTFPDPRNKQTNNRAQRNHDHDDEDDNCTLFAFGSPPAIKP